MRKWLVLAICLMLCAGCALAEGAALPEVDGTVTGEPEAPALTNPEARYGDAYMDKSDGSEQLLFAMLDAQNDEAADIEAFGALRITENQMLDAEGRPAVQVEISIQDCPYGRVMISSPRPMHSEINLSYYNIGTLCWTYDGERVDSEDGFAQENFDYFIQSYHFPYGSLEAMNGMRTDENGYSYLLVKSDDDLSLEFVVGENMRVVQTRLYCRDESGALMLFSYVDYDTGPAVEIPRPVLEAMGRSLTPVSPSPEPASGDEEES